VGRSGAFTIARPDPLPPTIDIFRVLKKNDEWYDYTLFHAGDRITCVIQLAWAEKPTAPVRIRLAPSMTPENAVDFSCPESVYVDPESVSRQVEFVATVGAVRENATVANWATVVGGSSRKACMASMEPGAGTGQPPYTGPYPAIASFSIHPASAAFGRTIVTMTVRLDRAVPLDVPVQLMSTEPGVIAVPPAGLVVPAGQTECVHSVTAGNPARQTTVILRALLPHAPTIRIHEHRLIVSPAE
jgi:hypothetical protein